MQMTRHRLKPPMRFVDFERVVSNLYRRVQHVSFRRSRHVALDHCAKRVLQKWNHLFRTAQMEVSLHAWQPLRTGGPSLDHRDVPQIAERISYRSLPVARDVVPDLINGSCTGIDRPREDRAGILHIQMNRQGSRRNLLIRVRQLNDRVSDRHFRMHDELRTWFSPDAKAFCPGKRVCQKFDELARPRYDDIRCNGAIPAGLCSFRRTG